MSFAKRLLCVCAAFSCAVVTAEETTVQGQLEYFQRTWKTDDGLPYSVVYRVCQDKTGFLWLATAGGLARFDGFEFKKFIPPDDLQKGGLNVRDLTVASDGSLRMIVASNQILCLRDGVFSVDPVSDFVDERTPLDLFFEPDDTLWVGCADGTLVRWHEGKATTIGRADGIERRMPRFSFASDREGKTWIASGRFLGYYRDGKLVKTSVIEGKIFEVTSSRSGLWVLADSRLYKLENDKAVLVLANPPWQSPTASSVRCFYEDGQGNLWFSPTNRGLYCLSNGKPLQIANPNDTIHSIVEDNEGNIWIGTDGEGLSMLKPKVFTCFATENDLSQKVTRSLCEDVSGEIIFANGHGGVVRKRGDSLQWATDKWAGIWAFVVCPDQKGDLWIANLDALYKQLKQDPAAVHRVDVPFKGIRTLYCAHNGDMWLAGSRGELGFYRGEKFTSVTDSGDRVCAIVEDLDGRIWIGGGTGALYCYLNQQLRSYGLSPMPIHALCVDTTGTLWIGTANGFWMKNGEKFVRFTESDGLPDVMIFQLLEDNEGRLWFGSRRGYFYVVTSQLRRRAAQGGAPVTAFTLNKNEGLSGMLPVAAAQPCVWKAASGSLWFATHQGAISINPTLLRKAGPPSPVLIDQVILDGQSVTTSGNLVIPPGKHRIEFRFSAISFSAPDKVRLRHRLQGVDADWVVSNNEREASYTGLSPGTYVITVSACNEDGVWNEQGSALVMTIIPFWWQTMWFRGIAFCLLMGSVALTVRYLSILKLRRRLKQLEQEHALEKERARIARDVHDELGSSVTGLRFLIRRLTEGDSDHSRERVIEQLSGQTQRLAFDLERVVWSVSPKNNSLDRLASYAGRFAKSFLGGASIECLLECPTVIPKLTVAPDVQHHLLSVTKEAINNVLKHSRATQVIVRAEYSDDVFKIQIRDNGIGFNIDAPENAERNGLGNMRSRVSEIAGQITVQSSPGHGTTVCVTVPIGTRLQKSVTVV